MKKEHKNILGILLRYSIMLAFAFPNFLIFSLIFAPLTLYLSYFLFEAFFEASLIGNVILIANCTPIKIIGACVASSAYYLLLALNLSLPNLGLRKRVSMILFSFLCFLILNILRIFLLGAMYFYSSPFFGIIHIIFWYFLSVIFVIAIDFSAMKIFRVKEIPFYSDIKFIYSKSVLKK